MMNSRIVLKQSRCFATTSQRSSILDYFKPKSTPTVPQRSTKDVINKVTTSELKTVRIPIIGKRNKERENLWKQRMNGFRVDRWIPNTSNYKKLVLEENLEPKSIIKKLVLQSYNGVNGTQLEKITDKTELSDLQKRFELVKQLQIEFGVSISDYELTKFTNLIRIKEYLYKELLETKKFNEKEPNAIHLNEEDFKGTNVSFTSYVSEGQKEKKFSQLLRKAKKLEKLENKKLLEAKLQEA